jgi:hypothetical protein
MSLVCPVQGAGRIDPVAPTGTEPALALGWLAGQRRATHSQRSRAGRAPVPSDQVPVRLHQASLYGAGQEHGGADTAVCAEQCVDGAKACAWGTGMSASAQRARAR